MRAAPELLGAPTIGGGVPSPGVVVERSYIPSQPYEIAKNGEKTGGFAHILAYKSPKTPFFALKYLTRYTHETFFKEYTNFKGHYLSHCRDIPLQSFGSHIRPQPHGLGLTHCCPYIGPSASHHQLWLSCARSFISFRESARLSGQGSSCHPFLHS